MRCARLLVCLLVLAPMAQAGKCRPDLPVCTACKDCSRCKYCNATKSDTGTKTGCSVARKADEEKRKKAPDAKR